MRKSLLLNLFLLFICKMYSQTEIKGRVVNERGTAVEYVSVWLENDSVGTISILTAGLLSLSPKTAGTTLHSAMCHTQKPEYHIRHIPAQRILP